RPNEKTAWRFSERFASLLDGCVFQRQSLWRAPAAQAGRVRRRGIPVKIRCSARIFHIMKYKIPAVQAGILI
ncbi:MAG: hypothetical protein SPJ01_03275, partial [Butyricicoccus sp.]|nr:hypothetical protein [Butyricicoccus sp.]